MGIALTITAIIGIIYGIINKNKPLGIISIIVLFMIIAVWVYFYNNPYQNLSLKFADIIII